MTRELQPVTHYLTGHADQLANVLRAADARGHLVRYDRPRRLADDRFGITVTLLEPVRRPRWYRRIPWKLVGKVAAIVAGLAVLAALGWGVAAHCLGRRAPQGDHHHRRLGPLRRRRDHRLRPDAHRRPSALPRVR